MARKKSRRNRKRRSKKSADSNPTQDLTKQVDAEEVRADVAVLDESETPETDNATGLTADADSVVDATVKLEVETSDLSQTEAESSDPENSLKDETPAESENGAADGQETDSNDVDDVDRSETSSERADEALAEVDFLLEAIADESEEGDDQETIEMASDLAEETSTGFLLVDGDANSNSITAEELLAKSDAEGSGETDLASQMSEYDFGADSDSANQPSEPAGESLSPEMATLLARLESRTESLMLHYEERIEQLLERYADADRSRDSVSTTATEENIFETQDDDPENDVAKARQQDDNDGWQAQRRALLASYGQNDDPFAKDCDSEVSEKVESVYGADEKQGHDAADEALSSEQQGKVEELKKELTSKLREAEIELSINRAKVAQQKAAIEELQADLECREQALEKKMAEFEQGRSGGKNGGISHWKKQFFGNSK